MITVLWISALITLGLGSVINNNPYINSYGAPNSASSAINRNILQTKSLLQNTYRQSVQRPSQFFNNPITDPNFASNSQLVNLFNMLAMGHTARSVSRHDVPSSSPSPFPQACVNNPVAEEFRFSNQKCTYEFKPGASQFCTTNFLPCFRHECTTDSPAGQKNVFTFHDIGVLIAQSPERHEYFSSCHCTGLDHPTAITEFSACFDAAFVQFADIVITSAVAFLESHGQPVPHDLEEIVRRQFCPDCAALSCDQLLDVENMQCQPTDDFIATYLSGPQTDITLDSSCGKHRMCLLPH